MQLADDLRRLQESNADYHPQIRKRLIGRIPLQNGGIMDVYDEKSIDQRYSVGINVRDGGLGFKYETTNSPYLWTVRPLFGTDDTPLSGRDASDIVNMINDKVPDTFSGPDLDRLHTPEQIANRLFVRLGRFAADRTELHSYTVRQPYFDHDLILDTSHDTALSFESARTHRSYRLGAFTMHHLDNASVEQRIEFMTRLAPEGDIDQIAATATLASDDLSPTRLQELAGYIDSDDTLHQFYNSLQQIGREYGLDMSDVQGESLSSF